jgi:DNA-binding GntR family transcriptional regulator
MSVAIDGPKPLEPLASGPSFTEATAEILRERILNGTFHPGARLVEAEIARQLGISRGPVREAIATLRAEGLVHEAPRKGSFVAQLSADDVREIYELRAALEGQAARLLCTTGTLAAFEEMKELLEKLRIAAKKDDRRQFAELDFQLHEQLCRDAGNGRIHKLWVNQVGVLRTLVRMEVTSQYETLGPLLEEHERLIAEIASRDPDRADAACRRHAAEALERVSGLMPAATEVP